MVYFFNLPRGISYGGDLLTNRQIIDWMNEWRVEGSSVPKFVKTDTKEGSDIRVKFIYRGFSDVSTGTDAQDDPTDEPTMTLNLCGRNDSMKKYEVLHETGHALGLEHEHQWIVGLFNKQVVIEDLKKHPDVTSEEAEEIYRTDFEAVAQATALDKDSIMKYVLRKTWIAEGHMDFFKDNYIDRDGMLWPRSSLTGELTDSDKELAKEKYNLAKAPSNPKIIADPAQAGGAGKQKDDVIVVVERHHPTLGGGNQGMMAASLFTFITGVLMCVAIYYYQVQQDAAQRSDLWKKQRKVYSSLLQEDPSLPGVVFSDDPKHETITSAGKKINMENDIGLSINIPEGSVVQIEEINMTITTSFSGPFQMPRDVESISPIFFVKLSSETAFHEDIEVKIQHNAHIESEEDFRDLVLLKASTIPTYAELEVSDANPEYRLEVVQGVRVEMIPGEPDFALVRLRGFSCFGLGREGRGDKVYTARLYKKFISPGARIEAVFCMCQQLQSYLKHCDDIIRKEYEMTARGKELTVYKGLTITGDEIELDLGPLDSSTWKINMDRPVIPKVEIDEISSSSLFSVFTSFFTEEVPIPYGYPPRIFLKFILWGKTTLRSL